MSPFSETLNTFVSPDYITATTTTGTSITNPGLYKASYAAGPTSITFTVDNVEEKTKEYCDKVDQHVDKLEEDIEFLNDKRKMNEELIERLINQNIQKDTQIKELEDAITFLKGYTSHLEGLIHVLEEKINE